MIEVEGLTKRFGQFAAVDDLSFTVRPGEVLGLVGPNGAGKTTTLRCLAGILPASSGRLRLAGHDLESAPLAAKQVLAYFPDEPRLFEYLSVRQHLAFIARLYQVADAEARSGALLAELELTEKATQLPGELSRGMKQKLAIACGLLHSPQVILFDEPLTGLDPYGIRRMKDTILRLAREGAAMVISSHLLHLVDEICSHLLILKQGRRVVHGTLAEVRERFAEAAPGTSLEEIFFRATAPDAPERPAGPS
jgi:ABC-2 type transport system ATP-binding protein